MTPETAADTVAQPTELTPENAELLVKYTGHLERSPLTGHSPRTYLGAVRAYLAEGCCWRCQRTCKRRSLVAWYVFESGGWSARTAGPFRDFQPDL
jgi:hypothetical protein